MAYRLVYTAQVLWVGPGIGPMGGALATSLPGAPAAGAQMLQFQNAQGGQNSNTFQAADITALTNAMAADLAAQMTTNITRIQNFSTGTG